LKKKPRPGRGEKNPSEYYSPEGGKIPSGLAGKDVICVPGKRRLRCLWREKRAGTGETLGEIRKGKAGYEERGRHYVVISEGNFGLLSTEERKRSTHRKTNKEERKKRVVCLSEKEDESHP